MKVVKKYHRTQCCICLENYEPTRSSTVPFLFSTDECAHRVCQSCMDAYADHVVKQQQDNRLSTLECPVQGCKQTFQLDQVISKALPFRHRLVFWWRQMKLRLMQNDNSPKKATKDSSAATQNLNVKSVTKHSLARTKQPTFATHVRSNKPSSSNLVVPPPKSRTNSKQPNTTWQVTVEKDKSKTHPSSAKSMKTVSGDAASSSSSAEKPRKDPREEFVEFALAKNWSRCPRCRHAVERISGCNYIYCRCGANFCYRCGKQHGYHHSACPDTFNGSELQAVRKAMFQN